MLIRYQLLSGSIANHCATFCASLALSLAIRAGICPRAALAGRGRGGFYFGGGWRAIFHLAKRGLWAKEAVR